MALIRTLASEIAGTGLVITQLAEEVEKLTEARDHLLAEYRKLLTLVDQVASGKTNPASIHVDLASESWELRVSVPLDLQTERGLDTPHQSDPAAL
jgi:hypothetical protein